MNNWNTKVIIPSFWWKFTIRKNFAIAFRKLGEILQKCKSQKNLGNIWKKNWKKIWKSSKKLKRSFQKIETIFWINFPHISVKISCNFQGYFKSLWENFRESMSIFVWKKSAKSGSVFFLFWLKYRSRGSVFRTRFSKVKSENFRGILYRIKTFSKWKFPAIKTTPN